MMHMMPYAAAAVEAASSCLQVWLKRSKVDNITNISETQSGSKTQQATHTHSYICMYSEAVEQRQVN